MIYTAILRLSISVSILFTCGFAYAAGGGGRHVVDLGCQGVYCFVTFDGANMDGIPGTTCAAGSGTEFRFNASTPDGKLIYTSMLTASVTGKIVDIYADHCLADAWGGVYVTITYFHVHN